MFGYIAVNKPELKIREFETYRSYYCGLCHSLKAAYGPIGQMTLTYDITFLLVLLTALYEPETTVCTGHCVMHPLKKHLRRENIICDYAADMNLLMAYYKCLDDWNDERKAGKGLMTVGLKNSAKRVIAKYPEKAKRIQEAMDTLAEGETVGCTELDYMAGNFGKVMAELFCYREDEWSECLRRMGFFLGKFIYLMDAYEDLEADRKKRTYNPLLSKADEPGFEQWCSEVLTMMMSECARAFEVLPVVQDTGLLRNVLYAGVWERYDQVKMRRVEQKNKDKRKIDNKES